MNEAMSATGLPTATPESVGLSAQRLRRLDAAFQGRIDSGRLAGVSVGLIRRGRLAWLSTLGQRDAARAQAMTPDTLFRLYSMSKPIATVAAMMLVEQGRLSLSDAVAQWLPSFDGQQVAVVGPAEAGKPVTLEPVRRPATVQDLLRHTSGLVTEVLYESTPVKSMYRKAGLSSADQTLEDFVQKLGPIPLAHQPGSMFDYGHSTNVLGRVIEVVAGQPLDRFIADNITGALGMTDTAFHVAEPDWPRLAEPVADAATGRVPPLRDVKTPPRMLSASAGMVGTLRDYLRFATLLLQRGALGDVRLLSPKTIAYMTSDHLGAGRGSTTTAEMLLGPGYSFGLGFGVRTSPGESAMPGSVGDYFWGGMAGTQFWVDPKEELAVVFMQQQPNEFMGSWQLLRQLVYQAIVE